MSIQREILSGARLYFHYTQHIQGGRENMANQVKTPSSRNQVEQFALF